jgi:hypothetical protein
VVGVLHVLLDGRRVTVVPRPGMPPIFDATYATEAEARADADRYAAWLRSNDQRRQDEAQRRSLESRQRFAARLRQRRRTIIHTPERRERTARTREHRARRAGGSRASPSRLSDDPEPRPVAAPGGASS